jgi:hypothetical protein
MIIPSPLFQEALVFARNEGSVLFGVMAGERERAVIGAPSDAAVAG